MKYTKGFVSSWWLVIYLLLISPLAVSQTSERLAFYGNSSTENNFGEGHRAEKKLSALLLSTRYKHISDITQYLVSEKFDGVQGVWDGKQLTTRKGKSILAPSWFTADFPDYPLIGELWIGYGQFETVSGLVRLKKRSEASDKLWKQVRFMVFEAPEHEGYFSERYDFMLRNLAQGTQPQRELYIKVVTQREFSNIQELDIALNRVIEQGGEGLMLHKKRAYYSSSGQQIGSRQNIIKLKPYYDDEARVVGYKPGKGKFDGMMGALIVETDKGVRFSLGSGFTLAQRQSPPAIHSVITFKYFGLTRK